MRFNKVLLVGCLFGSACTLAYDVEVLQDEQCADGEKACSGSCVSRLDPQTGCAGLSCVPCALANAASRCEGVRAECAIARCNEDFNDCNLRPDDGCEVDLAHDTNNCGECGRVCETPPNAQAGCGDGVCGIQECEAGFRDCNGDSADGCEVDLTSDTEHCGECGLSCGGGGLCEAGTCSGTSL